MRSPWRPRGRRLLPYSRITQFLPPADADHALELILARRHLFCPLSGDRNFLRLPEPVELLDEFQDGIDAVVSDAQAAFGIDLTGAQVEFYVHAYNDGTSFGLHADDHGGANWRRRISCVYFLHRQPCPFAGGALVVYDRHRRPHRVDPEHNSAVVFPSHLLHEVLPVSCSSGRFEDSRFAINIWFM